LIENPLEIHVQRFQGRGVDQDPSREVDPVLIGVSVLLLALGWNGTIRRGRELPSVSGLSPTRVTLSPGAGRLPEGTVPEEDREIGSSLLLKAVQLALIGLELVLLVQGADTLLESSIAIPRQLGVSELVIGLALFAAGTSLPEVATSVVAALRGEWDIAVGNVIASNLFYTLAVLGLSAAASPSGVVVNGAAVRLDIPVMIATTLVCLPIFFTGAVISRQEEVVIFLLTRSMLSLSP
jgi:cation:H+ antiporter